MYFFTGNNIFGQWIPHGKEVIDTFSSLSNSGMTQINHNFKINDAILLHVGWSHNIFRFDNNNYIIGDYKCKEEYIEVIHVPQDCSNSSKVTLISNDNHLIITNSITCEYWIINLENKIVRKLNLETEALLESKVKKVRPSYHISKCAVYNESLMFLTNNGSIYCGIIPNIIDSTHCKGEPVDIQCGNEHYMLLTSNGVLYTWGNGRRLQLGHGDVVVSDVPTEVEALSGIKIVKIAAGGWHSLVLSEFGDLYSWGWNESGQLGIKEHSQHKETLVSYALPTLVDIFDDKGQSIDMNIKEIACGAKHSAILLSDNSVWTTGSNKYGQLGLSKEDYISVPYLKKSHSFTLASELICGQWSTVINGVKSYIHEFYLIRT